MSAHLEENLRALDPQLAAEIGAAAPLPSAPELVATGDPTLTADGVLLHSRHDPRREAARSAETQPEPPGHAADTAAVLGFALGYHAEPLAAVRERPIVVVQRRRALLRPAL